MKNKIYILLALSLFSVSLMAGKADWVRNIHATGQWDIVGNITYNEAKNNALYEAKKEAMRIAGVGTDVRSASFTTISNGSEGYSEETFAQISSFYIAGRVRLCKEPVYEQVVESGRIMIKVSIIADVLKDQPTDPEFQIAVKGINRMYRVGEDITFSVKASKDCYVRVFWFDDTITGTGSLIYPLPNYDADEQLSAGKNYVFPLSSQIDYTTTISADKQQEQSFIFVLATKQQIPYMDSVVTFSDFFRWYYNIDSQDRTEYICHAFIVMK